MATLNNEQQQFLTERTAELFETYQASDDWGGYGEETLRRRAQEKAAEELLVNAGKELAEWIDNHTDHQVCKLDFSHGWIRVYADFGGGRIIRFDVRDSHRKADRERWEITPAFWPKHSDGYQFNASVKSATTAIGRGPCAAIRAAERKVLPEYTEKLADARERLRKYTASVNVTTANIQRAAEAINYELSDREKDRFIAYRHNVREVRACSSGTMDIELTGVPADIAVEVLELMAKRTPHRIQW